MKKNYYVPFILMIGMLFTGYSSFGQTMNSLSPEKKKDAAYIEKHQQMNNEGVKPDARKVTTATSGLSATLQKQAATAPDYYNPGSPIYADARTPRYPLTGDKAEDIANYKKAKAVWMANNPQQQKAAPAMNKKQAAERKLNGK